MKYRLNTYFAILIITIFGSGATLLIVHIATASTYGVFQYDTSAYDIPAK